MAESNEFAKIVDAINSYVAGQQAAVDEFKAKIESNNLILQGWVKEWDAFVMGLEPARSRVQALTGAETARVDSEIKVEELALQMARQELERFKALWAGISAKLKALTKL